MKKNLTTLLLIVSFAAVSVCHGASKKSAIRPAAKPAKPVAVPVSSGSSVNVSLAEAVAMALRKNIDLQVEALNSTMADADARRSRGIYDPFFTASANAGALRFPAGNSRSGSVSVGISQLLPTGGTVAASVSSGYYAFGLQGLGWNPSQWTSQAGVTVTQPLLRNRGKLVTEVSISLAENALKDSLDRYRGVAIDTVSVVIGSYNRLYALRQTLESKKLSLKAAESLQEEMQKKNAAGSVPRMELTNAEYGVIQRRKDLVDAVKNVRDQENLLRYYIGMEEKRELAPTDPPLKIEPEGNEDQAVTKALDLRPDIRQLRSSLESVRLQEKVAKNQLLPDLSVVAGGGVSGSSGPPSENLKQMGNGNGWWTAGVQLSYPIGNTAAENDYRRAKIRTEQVETQIRALSWKIRNEIEADMRGLISARLQIQIADKSREYAEQRLEEYRKNLSAGKSTTQDVLNAETDLSVARNSQIEAVESYSYAVTRLWHDTGELLDRQDVRIDVSRASELMRGKG
jgi:outer membrane protein